MLRRMLCGLGRSNRSDLVPGQEPGNQLNPFDYIVECPHKRTRTRSLQTS